MTETVNLYDAKTNLSKLVERAEKVGARLGAQLKEELSADA